MGVCTCSQNKIQNIKLDNILIEELGKNKYNDELSFKTKDTTSPCGISKGFKKFNLKFKKSPSTDIEVNSKKKNSSNKSSSQKKILNNKLSMLKIEPKIKKNYEKSILIYGDKESGKTSFIMKICRHKFDPFYIPSFKDERIEKLLRLKPYSKKFQFEFIVSNDNDNIKPADCYLIFFDVTCLKSLNKAMNLIEKKIVNLNKPIFLIGNKTDLKNNIDISFVNDFIQKYKCNFFTISIKESNGISLLLERLGEVLDYKDEILLY
jgi:signal recognition particle receptor subunit beta